MPENLEWLLPVTMFSRLFFLLYCSSIQVQVNEGFPEIGLSADLKQTLRQSARGWVEVSGWSAGVSFAASGRFLFGAPLEVLASRFLVPKSGIYFVSSSILLDNADLGLFRAAIICNNDLDNRNEGLTAVTKPGADKDSSLVIGGFVELRYGDKVSVYVQSESDTDWRIKDESDFSLRYAGPTASFPAFSAYRENSVTLIQGQNVIRKWKTSGASGAFKSLGGFSSSTGEFIAICEGVYIVAANIRLDTNSGRFVLSTTVNGQTQGPVFETKSITSDSVFTMNVFVTFSLRRGDVLALQINTSEILTAGSVIGRESGFSICRVDSFNQTRLQGISVITTVPQQVGGSGAQELRLWSIPHDNHVLFNARTVFSQGLFTCTEGGVHYVAASLRIRGGTGNYALLVVVSNTTQFSGNGGLYATGYNTNSDGVFSLAVSGLLELSSGQHLRVYAISTFSASWIIETRSGFSVVRATSHWPAMQSYNGYAPGLGFSSPAWSEVSTWKQSGLEGAFIFTAQEYLEGTTTRFTATRDGVYFVATNLVFVASSGKSIEAVIAVDQVPDTRNGLYAIQTNPSENFTVNIAGVVDLTRGHTISVFVRCARSGTWGIGDMSGFSVVFIGKSFAVPSMHVVLGVEKTVTTSAQIEIDKWSTDSGGARLAFQNGVGWTPNQGMYLAPIAGIYFVSCTLIFADVSDQYDSLVEVTIGVTARKTTTNGIQNTRNLYVTGSYASAGTLTLSASGAVKLDAGDYVVIRARSTVDVNWRVLPETGFSVFCVSPSSPSHIGAGFLSRKAANSIVTSSPHIWQKIGGWSTNSDLTNGLFLIQGESFAFEGLNGDVTIQRPGIYFISANVITSSTPFSFEAALRVSSPSSSSYTLTSGFHTLEKIPRSRGSYTLQFSGAVFLTKGYMVHVGVRSGTLNQYTIHQGSGFSIARLTYPTEEPGFTAPIQSVTIKGGSTWKTVTKLKSTGNTGMFTRGEGFDSRNGRFTASLAGIYIVSAKLVINHTLSQGEKLTVCMAVNGQASTNDGLVSGHVLQGDGSVSVSVTGAVELRQSDTVTIATLTVPSASFVIREGSMFSMVYLEERDRTTGNMVDKLSGTNFSSPGWQELVNWRSSGNGGQFKVGYVPGISARFVSPLKGVYLVTANVEFTSAEGQVMVGISLDNKTNRIVTVTASNDGSNNQRLNLVLPLQLLNFTTILVQAHSNDTNWGITSASSTSTVMISPEKTSTSRGFTARLTSNQSVSPYESMSWQQLSHWTSTGIQGFFTNTTGFNASRGVFISQESGEYFVSVNCVLSSFASTPSTIELMIAIDGMFSPETGLYSRQTLPAFATGTINAFSTLVLQSWDSLTVVVRSSSGAGFRISKETTFSVVLNDLLESPSLCSNSGPTLTREISPAWLRAPVGTSVTWTCDAIGSTTPSYKWLKDYQVIPSAFSSVLSVVNGQVSDSGDYVCIAATEAISTSSNIAQLVIYDPQPRFVPENYTSEVAENGPAGQFVVNLTLRAESKASEFARIDVGIIGGNEDGTFRLDTNDTSLFAAIYTTRSLDRENLSAYSLLIEAFNREEHALNTTASVNIVVLDQNDNKPVFEKRAYNISVYENATVGTVALTLLAYDADLGRNAHVTYHLLAGSGYGTFDVNSTTGEIILMKPVDRESRDDYTLFVAARDPKFNVYQEICIQILDVNEHMPIFSPRDYSVMVSEATLVGTPVVKVTADDLDVGSNARLSFSIVLGDPLGHFAIEDTGTITLAKHLDREQNETFNLTISVMDNGWPRLQSDTNALVMIQIVDLNDNNPAFLLSLYETTLLENATIGTSILRVRALDKDKTSTDSKLIYNIHDKGVLAFVINSSTGVVFVNKSLDFEEKTKYVFQVEARDNAEPPRLGTTRVVINVADINDNRPAFRPLEYNVSVLETTPVGTVLGRVFAEDLDSTSNAQMHYVLESGNINDTFYLDANTGSITLVREVDFELRHRYTLLVNVTDKGFPPLSSALAAIVRISLLDANDNNPVFDAMSYTGDVWENVSVGVSVLAVHASDRDSRANADLSYYMSTLSDAATRETLGVNASSGVIFTRRQIDYEQNKVFVFTVVARDNASSPRESQTRVQINIRDLNDNPPVFEPRYYQVTVSEHTQVNQTIILVSARDDDTHGANSRITFRVILGNTNRTFLVSDNGKVSLAKPLDYEQISEYKLTIEARDMGSPPLTSTEPAVIIIRVHDDNDNSPVFTQKLYSASVSENTTSGQVIVQVTAQDQDSEQNGKISYTIEPQYSETIAPFIINNTTGEISLRQRLDFDVKQRYLFVVIARDNGDDQRSASAVVKVTVTDVNDNNPVFDPVYYNRRVPENAPTGTTLVQLHAADNDTGQNALLDYEITHGNTNDTFAINQRGYLTVNKALDFESLQMYNLSVEARDSGRPMLVSLEHAQAIISITDVNDNAPHFDARSYVFRVHENISSGSEFGRVRATDEDSDLNSQLVYSLLGVNVTRLFQVNKTTGTLYVISSLDYEIAQQYEFPVCVSDLGYPPLKDFANIRVDILDINDNRPVFLPVHYHVTVSEAALPGTTVVRLTLHDDDSTVSGVLDLTILSGNEHSTFTLDNSGSLLLYRPLDFEDKKLFNLTIRASDRGMPSLTSTPNAHVLISVYDVNDNQPTFDLGEYWVSIPENTTIGTRLLQVRAVDRDSGNNSWLTYHANLSVSHFNVSRRSGEIILVKALDYELQKVFSFVVQAIDGGLQPKIASTNVNIQVIDVNDNFPFFSPVTYGISVTEATHPGTVITKVTAHDNDSSMNAQLRFVITHGNDDGLFFINDFGEITLMKRLDFENTTLYNLSVLAYDHGLTPLASQTAAQLIIRVLDENDNTPTFNRSLYTAVVKENISVGAFVLNLTAKDRDTSKNQLLSYRIDDPSVVTFFHLDNLTGELRTAGVLDYELRTTFRFSVFATDNGKDPHTGTTLVHIEVQDINDNMPVFVPYWYNVTVDENTLPGMPVVRVSAHDNDSTSNARLRYGITSGNAEGIFDINDQGKIWPVIALDHELVRSYNLTIDVCDLGTPIFCALRSATVLINVFNANDNAPAFNQTLYTAVIPEDFNIHGDILQVFASERDSGLNGLITYHLVHGAGPGHFTIDNQTGVIRSVGEFDYETQHSYAFSVIARDHGHPVRRSQTRVHVQILDVNDNRPYFLPQNYLTRVSESAYVGTTITAVQAFDADSTSNAILSFSIKDGNFNETFTVDNGTGVISSLRELDFETMPNFTLHVSVSDNGKPRMDSLHAAEVLVLVQDENDNSPVFSPSHYFVTVYENFTVGDVLFVAHASDRDSSSNGKVTYHISSSSSPADRFMINPTLGNVTVTSEFDFEEKESHEFVITARDWGQPSRSSFAHAHVTVLDVNDNAPTFTANLSHVMVTEATEVGTTITRVAVHDNDSGLNGLAKVSIRSGNLHETFTINPNTGDIGLAKPLDKETTGNYTLVVMATDEGSPPLESLLDMVVQVTVTDVNDNFPKFTKDYYNITIPENTSVESCILRVVATDRDSRAHGRVKYFMAHHVPGSMFAINNETGLISLQKALDFEVQRAYIFQVFAEDNGKALGSCLIEITVTDINDNNPAFNPAQYSIVVAENAQMGRTLLHLAATDDDYSSNAQLSFQIIHGNNDSKFQVNAQGFLIVSSNLDYEKDRLYNLSVEARDNGSPALSSLQPARVLIEVSDMNDNAPVFNQSEYSVRVYENTTFGTDILAVIATDRDSGPNGQVLYSIVDRTIMTTFGINNTSGMINVTGTLDREVQPAYTFMVVAHDSGLPTRTATSLVRVIVQDCNDNHPKFRPDSYTVLLSEDARVGSRVVTVSAVDSDDGVNAVLVYAIIDWNSNSTFGIANDTGSIWLAKQVDKEDTPEFRLVVSVRDKGVPSLKAIQTALVRIIILDVNDNIPTFTQAVYEKVIPEDTHNGSLVLRARASDIDQTTNSSLRYYIADDLASKYFSINDATGEIYVKSDLDYEQITWFRFRLFAEDEGRPPLIGQCMVIINISDINDNHPVFSPIIYRFSISESTAVGTFVAAVTATDLDSTVNKKLTFVIKDKHDDHTFYINHSGMIYLNTSLDFESTKIYNLTIVATDHGNPRRSSLVPATVIFEIRDENDCSPIFAPNSYTVIVAENISLATSILSVTAHDADSEANGLIVFSLDSGETNCPFNIDNETGHISTIAYLDYENKTSYELIIKAQDQGVFPRIAFVVARITVTDINDNPPVFKRTYYHLHVTEATKVATKLVKIQAIDMDSGLNAKLRYSFLNGSYDGTFSLDIETGVVSTSKALDGEAISQYNLTIGVRDSGNPSLSALDHAIVTITVLDENHHRPAFDQEFYQITLYLDWKTPVGTIVIPITAKDKDTGDNGEVHLSIGHTTSRSTSSTSKDYTRCTNETNGLFDIDEHTGILRVAGRLASSCQYNVTVIARDYGSPPLASDAVLVISTTARNETPPILQPPQTILQTDMALLVVVICFFLVILALLLCLFVWKEARRQSRKKRYDVNDAMGGKAAADGTLIDPRSSDESEDELVIPIWHFREKYREYSSSSSFLANSSPCSSREGTRSSDVDTDILDTFSQRIASPRGFYTISGPETQTYDFEIEFGSESDAYEYNSPLRVETDPCSDSDDMYVSSFHTPPNHRHMYIPVDTSRLGLFNTFDDVTASESDLSVPASYFGKKSLSSSTSTMDITYDAYRYEETPL